jgi:phenylalanyl-tRNA synthetase alpha chain
LPKESSYLSSALHPIERSILRVLASTTNGNLSFESLVRTSRLNEDQIRRGLQWLSSKGLVAISETKRSKLVMVGTPSEVILMEKLQGRPEGIKIEELRMEFESPEAFSSAFGRAKAAGWIIVGGAQGQAVTLGNQGMYPSLTSLLEAVKAGFEEGQLEDHQRPFVPDLIKRGLLKRAETVETQITLTDAGRKTEASGEETDLLDKLTPEVLASGSWRGKKLRPIDVEAKAPRFFPGRRHPVRDFIREVKETYISMGFTELEGDSVHPAFWNFDALFIPQDHPGREMQDTFYLEGLSDQTLKRSGLVANVASVHEHGWKTGSRGWGYTWRIEEARRLVLRTHNTVLTVKALSESKEKDTRVFAVSKVYRNENLDYKHLAEFYQMDGIIVGRGLNVRHLMGFLTEFYKKLGMSDVKLWPTYFPYTEPSLEVVGYSKATKSWIELSGSGVFRPEVTVPLGVKVPVLAWGPGIERLMLMRFGLDDMRALYGADIDWLRRRVELASSQD